jgi:glucan 1,3-beta-glucosidase
MTPKASRLVALPALLAATVAAFLFWRWMGTSVRLPDVPGNRLHCLSYTPFEPGDVGATAPGRVSTARIESDLAQLRTYTDCLRVYTPLGNTPRVLAIAERLGVRVLLGAWIGSDLDQNEKEIRSALDLARRHPQTVTAIVVGNEVLLRREMSGARLAELIRSVKAESPVPVAYGDVAHFIVDNPAVAEAADILLIHLLPYWDDPRPPPAGEAVEQVIEGYEEFRGRLPPKELWIGETGWPSKGRMRGPGKPGLLNEAGFVRGFAARAAQLGIRYNVIEAIDQPWKRAPEGTVGGFWGILDARREPKFALQGPVSAWPRWRGQCAATIAAAIALLAGGLRSRPRPAGWAGLAATGLALGLALVFQWDYVAATSLSAWGWAAGAAAAVLSITAAIMLSSVAAGSGRGGAASLAALGRALTAPGSIVRTPSLRRAAFVAVVTIPAAWISLILAFAPRYRDVPIAQFALPAVAIAVSLRRVRIPAMEDRREEAVLAALLLSCGLMHLETGNPESLAWLAICASLASPWLGSLGGELARVRRLFADARQPQKDAEHR